MAESPICKRLKETRIAAGLSQKKLGMAAGMDEFSASSRMNHYELGRHTPDFDTLKRIAKALKVPVAYFYAESDILAEIIISTNLLSLSKQKQLLQQLKSSRS